MIKRSLYEEELALLKKRFGPENVMTVRSGWSVMINNFVPPPSYRVKSSRLFIEVGEGFGFGMGPINSFISLPEKYERMHLFRVKEDLFDSLTADFKKFPESVKTLHRGESWFWMCFHFSSSTRNACEGSGAAAVEAGADIDFVGIVEYVSAINFVLKKISESDPDMISSMHNMADNYENAAEERKRMLEMFRLELNWKRIKWMY